MWLDCKVAKLLFLEIRNFELSRIASEEKAVEKADVEVGTVLPCPLPSLLA